MRKWSILAVEDEQTDVILLNRVFARAGIQTPLQVATDGEMAIDYLSGIGGYANRDKYPLPCLVLLDIKLPKRGGLEVLSWIRKESKTPNLVVVIFSSSAQQTDIERAYQLGANSYIQKPVQMEQFYEIAELLKGWWLGYNHFPPVHQISPPSVSG